MTDSRRSVEVAAFPVCPAQPFLIMPLLRCLDLPFRLRALAVFVFCIASILSLRAEEPRITDLATAQHERLPVVPSASDVTMRSLRFRPRQGSDPHDTLNALREFHATRL